MTKNSLAILKVPTKWKERLKRELVQIDHPYFAPRLRQTKEIDLCMIPHTVWLVKHIARKLKMPGIGIVIIKSKGVDFLAQILTAMVIFDLFVNLFIYFSLGSRSFSEYTESVFSINSSVIDIFIKLDHLFFPKYVCFSMLLFVQINTLLRRIVGVLLSGISTSLTVIIFVIKWKIKVETPVNIKPNSPQDCT